MVDEKSIEELRALLAKATPGSWEADNENNDGCYGLGDDCHEGFQSASIHAPDGRGGYIKLFDALNSDAACIEEEWDEDQHYAWDEVSRANAALVVAMRNALPDLLDAAERLERQVRAKQQEIEEIAARAQENYERALAAERLASRAREDALREATVADLLPCPFCGSTKVLDNVIAFLCQDCNASVAFYTLNGRQAIAAWNRRVPVAGWQPIETAPVDQDVLLYCPNLGVANPERIELGPVHTSRGSHHAWATMWMPLPAAPVDGGKDA